ncbi:MAG: response regulator [Chloroflexi bacterium]|nr:response regulator [Chloroflexota bacterium]
MAQWRILVADDSPEIAAVVEAALDQDGRFDVFLAANGEEALKMARLHMPHLILLDVMMPRIHGLKVCKTLKSDDDTSQIKIIVLSALARDYTKREAFQNGADGYITKPFNLDGLINDIEATIRGGYLGSGSTDVGSGNIGKETFVFNRGDEVRVRLAEDEAEVGGIVMSRIPPGQWQEAEWGYRIALDSGGEALVKWNQVTLVNMLEHA